MTFETATTETTSTDPVAPYRIQAVAFDLDGLIFNTEAVFNRTLTDLLARRGKPAPPELFAAMMGLRAKEAHGVMSRMMEIDEPLETLQAETSELFQHHLEDLLAPMPGVAELLAHLEATGRPKCVCTSSGRDYALGLLRRYDWHERFEFVLGAEDVTNGKPHPEVYATAIDRLGSRPNRTMVLEDSSHGVAAGSAAGAFTVGVPHEHTRGQSHEAASLVADTLADPRLYDTLSERGVH